MRKHLEPWAPLAQSNRQVASKDRDMVGMKGKCTKGLIMKSPVGGWLCRVHVNINDRFLATDSEAIQKSSQALQKEELRKAANHHYFHRIRKGVKAYDKLRS